MNASSAYHHSFISRYPFCFFSFFFFNAPSTTEIYTLSLHDALPIFHYDQLHGRGRQRSAGLGRAHRLRIRLGYGQRSEEHTSELQSRFDLVCRLLLEKKKKDVNTYQDINSKMFSPENQGDVSIISS